MKSKSRGLLLAVGYAAFAIATCGTSALYAGEESEYLNFTAVGGDVSIGMRVTEVPGPSFTPSATLEYSFDPTNNLSWKKLTIGGSMTIPGGQTAYFRGSGSNRFAFPTSGPQLLTRCCFTMSADNEVTIKAGGNILSLHYSDLKHKDLKALQQKTVAGLFEGCDILTEPPLLTSTNLTDGCYAGLFGGCTALARAPELPAVVLSRFCYQGMFKNCRNLMNCPPFKAEKAEVGSCSSMFSGCSALVSVPFTLSGNAAKQCCANMFSDCISLLDGVKLNSSAFGEESCLAMFSGCTSLLKSPSIQASELDENCFKSMFMNCARLMFVVADLPSYDAKYTSNWLKGVSSAGVLVVNQAFEELVQNYLEVVPTEDWCVDDSGFHGNYLLVRLGEDVMPLLFEDASGNQVDPVAWFREGYVIWQLVPGLTYRVKFQTLESNRVIIGEGSMDLPADSDVFIGVEGGIDYPNVGWSLGGGLNDVVGYIESNTVLKVRGEGKTIDYASPDEVPWESRRLEIESLVVDDGVEPGANVLRGLDNVKWLNGVNIERFFELLGAMGRNKKSGLVMIVR